MYHKVFINNVELAFSTLPIAGYNALPALPENHDLETWITTLRDLPEGIKYLVLDAEGEQWNAFVARHTVVYAAGGLVTNTANELLVIRRLGFWDLPKGKRDAGETPAQCALREVQEECGIAPLTLAGELEATYHTYAYNGQNVLKKTHWFAMHYSGLEKPIPQTEEDITAVEFMAPAKVASVILETYPSLRPLFNAYLSRNK